MKTKREIREQSRIRQAQRTEKLKAMGYVKKAIWLSPGEREFFDYLFSNKKENFYKLRKVLISGGYFKESETE